MARVEKSLGVHVPVRVAYNQWTQFEAFPCFMEGVRSVRQFEDDRLHWVAEVAGRHKEWDARITEQIPDQRIASQSEVGTVNHGPVVFVDMGDRTLVTVEVEFEPESAVETIGSALGFVSGEVGHDLTRFKAFVERRAEETGECRGEVHDSLTAPGAARVIEEAPVETKHSKDGNVMDSEMVRADPTLDAAPAVDTPPNTRELAEHEHLGVEERKVSGAAPYPTAADDALEVPVDEQASRDEEAAEHDLTREDMSAWERRTDATGAFPIGAPIDSVTPEERRR